MKSGGDPHDHQHGRVAVVTGASSGSRVRRLTSVPRIFEYSRERLLRGFQMGQHRCRHGGGLASLQSVQDLA